MLTQLYIQNIAVIERASIDFGEGFHVFTGETGAGKSILIGAIGAVLGFRVSRDLIRTGAEKAMVTALFERLSDETCSALSSLGYEPEEDGTLLLSREFSAEGKSSCKIGGRPATVSILREVADTLINIHGQHDNQALISPERHIRFIDSYAGDGELLAQYRQEYAKLCSIKQELEKLNMDEVEKAYRIDLLTYQIDEISSANLKAGEEEELLEQKKQISNSAKIIEAVGQADLAFSGDDENEGLVAMLDSARDALSTAGRYYADLEGMASRVDEMYYELREYASDLRRCTSEMDFNEGDLDAIEARLDTIYKLKRKYGASVEEVLDYLGKSTQELQSINRSEEMQAKLEAQLAQTAYSAQKLAEALSEKRREAAKRLTEAVGEELRFLDMPFVRLEVKSEIGALSADGIDDMEFLISTNPGEPLKPLSKIASGGELSRVMLSLKNVLADRDRVGTLIFDEVDTGVSGRAAQKVGLKLKQASHGRQIICVTHLAQVAAYADRHYLIEKSVRDGRTFTDVRPLDRSGRVSEIARIIGGNEVTDTILSSADEMLRFAERQVDK